MAIWPNGSKTIPRVTGEFGFYPDGTPHYGIDLADFDLNLAVLPGTVLIADQPGTAAGDDAGGVEVRILHDNGDIMRYLHNLRPLVAVGQRVYEGQPIGVQGSSGYMTTGKHLHFEIWRGGSSGNRVNPKTYWGPIVSTSTSGGIGIPFPTTTERENMIIYRSNSASADGVIPAGMAFIQGTEGPLRPLSAAEDNAYKYWDTRGIPTRVAGWGGEAIRALTRTVGLMQWSGLTNLYPVLTGKIIYSDPSKADYPKVSGTSVAVPEIDYTKIKVPTASEIAALIEIPTVEEIAAEVIRQQKLPGN